MLSRPGHILVADHQGNLDKFVCNVVGQEHWLIQRVESLQELEQQIFTDKPDIIVLNAHLPKIQFSDLNLRMAQAYGKNRPFTILAISRDPEPFMQRSIQLSVDEVLIAPFYGLELLTKIHNFVRTQSGGTVPIPLPAPINIAAEVVNKTEVIAAQKVEAAKAEKAKPRRLEKHEAEAMKPLIQRDVPRAVTAIKAPSARKISKNQPEAPTPKPAPVQAVAATPAQAPIEPSARNEWSLRKKMTMLVVRINGLEKAVEELDAAVSIKRTNELYQAMTDEISRLGGKVVSRHGDTLVAVFNNSILIANHRISALQAAMQLQLSSMFFAENYKFISQISLSCVLHTAMMTIGGTESSPSTETTLIGSALPLAMRLLEHCPLHSIIATYECYHDVESHVCIAEEFSLEDPTRSADDQIRFALISGINTTDFVMNGVKVFRAG